MADFGKIYNQYHGQEVEKRNEARLEENDSNNTVGSNIYGDIFKEIENCLFSDESFPALSNVSALSLSSSSALHWLHQLDQIHEPNMHPNPAPLQPGSDTMVQEPDLFNHSDSFLLPEIPELDQPSKLFEGNAIGTYSQSDPDTARMFLDWLKFNRGSISREDLKTITLNKATVENAASMLGNSKEGNMKLVQLILAWVQEHRLHKNKPPLVNIPNCLHPYSNICGENQMFASSLCGYNSQPSNSQPFSSQLPPPPPPPQTVEQYISLAPKEARKKRTEHLRRLSVSHSHKTNIVKPASVNEGGTSTRFCKYDRRIHSLRTNRQSKLQNDANRKCLAFYHCFYGEEEGKRTNGAEANGRGVSWKNHITANDRKEKEK